MPWPPVRRPVIRLPPEGGAVRWVPQAVNVETVLRLRDEAAGSGAAIISLPELSLTKYFGHWNTREHARMFDEVLGPVTRPIQETAFSVDRILRGCPSRRPARRAAHPVRAGGPPRDGEDARPDDPALLLLRAQHVVRP